MILGNYCTRSCRFCAIETRDELPLPDKKELFDIKEAVKKLDTHNVVITSVTRDDLDDGGAGHFADCIEILRQGRRDLKIEVLVPDFLGKRDAVKKIVRARPDTTPVETLLRNSVNTLPMAIVVCPTFKSSELANSRYGKSDPSISNIAISFTGSIARTSAPSTWSWAKTRAAYRFTGPRTAGLR